MTCEKTISLLSAYIDNELGYEEFRQVELHLVDCEACQAECRDLRAVKELMGTLKAAELPRDFWPGMRERLGARAPAPSRVGAEGRGARGRSGVSRWMPGLFLSPLGRALAPVLVVAMLVAIPLAWGAIKRPSQAQAYSQSESIEPYFRAHVISEYDRPLSDKASVDFVVAAQAVTMYASDQIGLSGPSGPSVHAPGLRNPLPREAPDPRIQYASPNEPR